MCENTIDLKRRVRKEVIERRNAIPADDRLAKSQVICDTLIQDLQPGAGDIIAVYSAMTNEVSLHNFILHCFNQGATVCFPVMMKATAPGEPQLMDFRTVNATQYRAAMELQRWTKSAGMGGMLQASASPTVAIQKTAAPFVANPLRSFAADDSILGAFTLVKPKAITHMITPLVAFDKNDNRLGYGGGNYDRYLPQLSKNCDITAVAFREQEVDELPTEEHDVKVFILAV